MVGRKMAPFRDTTLFFLSQKESGIVRNDGFSQGHSIVFCHRKESGVMSKDGGLVYFPHRRQNGVHSLHPPTGVSDHIPCNMLCNWISHPTHFNTEDGSDKCLWKVVSATRRTVPQPQRLKFESLKYCYLFHNTCIQNGNLIGFYFLEVEVVEV
jgi:hypothetical protein